MTRKYGYMVRTCSPDMTSHKGFRWPESGPVECSDWSPKPECGHGLHGLLWAVGDCGLLDWSPSVRWLLVKVVLADVVAIDGGAKVKVPRGEVVFCGARDDCLDLLATKLPKGVLPSIVHRGERSVSEGLLYACGSSVVTAYGSSSVTAYDSSSVTARGSSSVTAYDSSSVTARGSSSVTAYGINATVEAIADRAVVIDRAYPTLGIYTAEGER